MGIILRKVVLRSAFLFSTLFLLLTGCQARTSMLDPHGPAAARINNIWWLMFGISFVIFIFVMILLVIALVHNPQDETPLDEEDPNTGAWFGNTTFVVINGIAIPAVILLIVFFVTMNGMQALVLPLDSLNLNIEVTGHQFWWEIEYPDYGVVTANELHIPVNEPVNVTLKTDDVIHSFWIPELQGKMDLIPGQVNRTWIEASDTGTYLGVCAEFCGVQHTNMEFLVIAETREEFEAWISQQQQPSRAPSADIIQQGWEVFQDEGRCAECHAIRGTNATGRLGPDLTHFASRSTLGAGVAPNTRGYLTGWIVDAQSLKPGSHMPPIELSSSDLHALVAYLETLE